MGKKWGLTNWHKMQPSQRGTGAGKGINKLGLHIAEFFRARVGEVLVKGIQGFRNGELGVIKVPVEKCP